MNANINAIQWLDKNWSERTFLPHKKDTWNHVTEITFDENITFDISAEDIMNAMPNLKIINEFGNIIPIKMREVFLSNKIEITSEKLKNTIRA